MDTVDPRYNWPIIQLHSPETWHDDQVIVLNAEGRRQLKALLDSDGQSLFAMTSDGEGFDLVVLETEDIDKYPLPYTHESAALSPKSKWDTFWCDVYNIVTMAEKKRREETK